MWFVPIVDVATILTTLGSPLWGTDSFFAASVEKVVSKVKDLHSAISDLQDPQLELRLLRSCLGVCKVNHILRTVPSTFILQQLIST